MMRRQFRGLCACTGVRLMIDDFYDDGENKYFQVWRTHLLVPGVGNVGQVECAY